MSRRLTALLHKCAETTENVALLCLCGLRKTDRALKRNDAPLIVLALGDTHRTGRIGALLKCVCVLVEPDDQISLMICVKCLVQEGLIPMILRFQHHFSPNVRARTPLKDAYRGQLNFALASVPGARVTRRRSEPPLWE